MIIRGKVPGTEPPVDILVENGKVIRVEPYAKGSRCDFGGTDLECVNNLPAHDRGDPRPLGSVCL